MEYKKHQSTPTLLKKTFGGMINWLQTRIQKESNTSYIRFHSHLLVCSRSEKDGNNTRTCINIGIRVQFFDLSLIYYKHIKHLSRRIKYAPLCRFKLKHKIIH